MKWKDSGQRWVTLSVVCSGLGVSRDAEGLRPALQEASTGAPLLFIVRREDLSAIKILTYLKGSLEGLGLFRVVLES